MNLQSLRLVLSDEDISGKQIVQFYITVGKLLGVEAPPTRYDCTKILIARNIQDAFYKTYEELHPEEFAKDPNEFQTQVAMLLCQGGPKVEDKLLDNMVEIQEGFIDGRPLSSLIKISLRKIAVVEDGYVRDTQIYIGDPAALNEDNQDWENDFGDIKYPCQYVGIFEGESDEEIKAAAAAVEGVHPDIISLIEIPGGGSNNV